MVSAIITKKAGKHLHPIYWVLGVTVAVGLFFLLAILMSGCKSKSSGSIETPSVKNFQTSTQSQWNGQTITGTVTNLNSERISFVAVEYDLVNDKHMVIRTVTASSDAGIEPNGSWDFQMEAGAIGARSTRLKNTFTR